MEVKQAGDRGRGGRRRILRSPEAHSENTHDDVSYVTVMVFSLYASLGARVRDLLGAGVHRERANRDLALTCGYR